MQQGIERPSHMARRTGLTFRTAKRWMDQVRKQWADALSAEERNFRQELLYREAEAISRDGWEIALGSNNRSVVIGALRTILASNSRRADLIGCD